MDGSLGQHAVVLELGLAERGSVASDDDQLGLAGAQALEGGLVAERDYSAMSVFCIVFAGCNSSGHVPLPDFMTSASLELMLLASRLLFLTAILTVSGAVRRQESLSRCWWCLG